LRRITCCREWAKGTSWLIQLRKEPNMSHPNHTPRRLIYTLIFAALLTLAGLGLLGEVVQANPELNEKVFLPLINRNFVPAGTLPQ
jgi:hypothetical protein